MATSNCDMTLSKTMLDRVECLHVYPPLTAYRLLFQTLHTFLPPTFAVFGPGKRQHQLQPNMAHGLTRRRPFSWAHPGKRDSSKSRRGFRKHRPATTAVSCLDLYNETSLLDQTTRDKSQGLSNLDCSLLTN